MMGIPAIALWSLLAITMHALWKRYGTALTSLNGDVIVARVASHPNPFSAIVRPLFGGGPSQFMYYWRQQGLAADVVFLKRDSAGRSFVRLITRKPAPHSSDGFSNLALPGGFNAYGTSSARTALQEVAEEMGYGGKLDLTLLGAFDHPLRDPRGAMTSLAYLATGFDHDELGRSRATDTAETDQHELYDVSLLSPSQFSFPDHYGIVLAAVDLENAKACSGFGFGLADTHEVTLADVMDATTLEILARGIRTLAPIFFNGPMQATLASALTMANARSGRAARVDMAKTAVLLPTRSFLGVSDLRRNQAVPHLLSLELEAMILASATP